MNSLVDMAVSKRVITLFITGILVVGGIISFNNLGRLEDPEFTIKDAVVYTAYPGATPREVEEEVTDLLETEIQKMPQIKQLESISANGLSTITVTIQDKYVKDTLPAVWEELRRKIGDAQSQLPPGAGPSLVIDDFGDVYGVLYAITGDGYSIREIKEYAKFLRRELLQVQDVAKITLWGERQEGIYVEISRTRIAELGFGLDQVYRTLEQQNVVVSAGSARVGDEFIRIDPTGSIDTIEDISNLVIGSSAGTDGRTTLIYLRDIADVTREYVDPPQRVLRFNGQNAIGLGISTAAGGNVVTMGEALKDRLKELEEQTPVGLDVKIISMQSDAVVASIDAFIVSFLQAVLIVIVVLLLAMGLRTGLIIGAVLVVTVLGTFIIMANQGVLLERISLGALIIALGMLVDNAIVVSDGMLVRIQAGMDRLKAAREVVGQTMWPLLGATAIAILAFAAIGLSQDATGEFTRSLFNVMLYSLSLSWVLAITLTPLLCVMFLKAPAPSDGDAVAADPYGSGFYKAYKSFLAACISQRWLTITGLIGALGLSIYGFTTLDDSFFPPSTRNQFMLHYWLPEGSDIRATQADMEQIETRLMADDRVDSVSTFLGAGAPRFLLTYSPEKDYASYSLALVTVHDYRDIDAMAVEYRAYMTEQFPNAEPKIKKFKLGPAAENDIEVRITGRDPSVLRDLSRKVQAIMKADPGATGFRDDWRQRVKVLRPIYSDTRAQQVGVSRKDLAQAMEANFLGTQVGIYREGDELIPIYSRAPASERRDIRQINDMQVWSSSLRHVVPVVDVVSSFGTEWEDATIHRRDRRRTITVSCDAAYELPSKLLARIMPQINALEIPTGYSLEWGAEFENSADAQEALAGSIPTAILMMFLVLVLLFNSLRIPILIWLTVPFAVVGVSVGLILTSQPFNFMAILGFLSLVGLLIKNAIVLLDEVNIQLEEGLRPYAAVMQAAVSRARPVAMAAVTTVLGMVPLLFDPFYIAMAVTIMGGLTFATLLTLVVVPVLYAIFFNIKAE
ncbi:MAG: efflux RND transporter permease subunit [Alphaproteobacteria bacterium]|nr:MAG: efflux RND transporter permease subunit [Alphaproteobacteria bacterium]